MPSDPIAIANITKDIIVEESFLSHEPWEVKDEVEPQVEDKSTLIPVDDLISALRSLGNPPQSWKPLVKLGNPNPS